MSMTIWMQEGAAAAATAVAPVVEAPKPCDTGSTAWVLCCTALVLLMTLPGLALFYGGLVRRKNILSVMMQCLASAGLVTVLWVICGYSLAFAPNGNEAMAPWIGGLQWSFLDGVTGDTSSLYGAEAIPHLAFCCFQLMFAIITPALIAGAFAERMRFGAFCLFSSLWLLLVYCPIAHWVWGDGGWMNAFNAAAKVKAYDYAGGTVVHINAGIAALVCALYLGRRKGYPQRMSPPHNLPFAVIGAALLWVGWFGFNAGSALGASGDAAKAFIATQIAAAAAGLVWALLDWGFHGKPTVLGFISGVVAGLVAITPACGFVSVKAALFIGLVASLLPWIFVVLIKPRLKLDDTLDAFGVHGIAGCIGALLTGPLCTAVAAGEGFAQFVSQFKAVAVTVVYGGVMSLVILFIVNLITRVRADEKEETIGLDVSQHKESAYTLID